LSPASTPFSSGYFRDRVLLFAWATILPFYTSYCSWGDECVPPTQLFLLRWGVASTFFDQAGQEPQSFQSQPPK
jgi:hypothetical protein